MAISEACSERRTAETIYKWKMKFLFPKRVNDGNLRVYVRTTSLNMENDVPSVLKGESFRESISKADGCKNISFRMMISLKLEFALQVTNINTAWFS